MTEQDFWISLMFRLCEEFAGLPEQRHRYFWCDGLYPERYEFEGASPRIAGKAVIYGGTGSIYWQFALMMPVGTRHLSEVDWKALLPPKSVTCWMSFDEQAGTLEMDPSVARPDLK